MIKKQVTYRDYEDVVRTMTLYFNLSKFEWLEIETYTKGGLIQNLNHAVETNNTKKTIDLLKKIILTAYGEKNPETGAFEKSEEKSIAFSKTEMFSELFYELAYNAEASQEFFIGLVPTDNRDEVKKKIDAEMANTGKTLYIPTAMVEPEIVEQ